MIKNRFECEGFGQPTPIKSLYQGLKSLIGLSFDEMCRLQ